MFYNKNIMDKKIIEYLCAKDEQAANAAAKEFIKNCNTEEFKTLCEKMECLFDFVRENVYKRLKSAINENNYKNIINLFQIYSPYFDDFFPSVLAKYANENLTDEILELLNKGDDAKKTYCAGYFSKIPDTVAKQDLINNLETEFEPLFLKSSLLITDFTSNVYEMGTINKPCIYFRPDKEDFKQHLIKQDGSYFDVKKEGIGPCVDDINSLFIELDKLLKNKYKLEDVYLNKRKEQIIFANDSNCCERIFKSILESRKWEIINKPKKEEIIVKKENTNHDALPSLKDCSIWFN